MAEAIRDFGRTDAARIAELEVLCFAVPWSSEMLESELTNPASRYRVLEIDGQIVAYAGMWLVLDEAYITNIAVHPDYRGRGLGEAILRDMIRIARENGAVAMTLEVRVSNAVAQALYRKLGFAQEGLRKGFYADNNEDALILWNRDLIAVV